MENVKTAYKNFPAFVLRTPLFPFNFLKDIFSEKNTPEKKLKEICKKENIQEALFLASPDLQKEIDRWLKNELTNKKEIEKLQVALAKYLLRMASRCTPFGLFAGCTVGRIDNNTKIVFPEQKKYLRHTRLDMNYLCALAQALAKHPNIKDKIKYFPNTSIHKIGSQLRYVEYSYLKSKRTHHVVAVNHTGYLEAILKACENGAYKPDLANLLVDDEITTEEALGFIDELIVNQLLISELEPAITGAEFLDQILEILQPIEKIDEIKQPLLRTKNLLQKIDRSPIGVPVTKYYDTINNLKPLGTEYELKYMFQADMVKPATNCTLNNEIARNVWEALEVMNRFSISPTETNITNFCNAFRERYEETEIPLLDALDVESGIGYLQNNSAISGDVTPLIDDIVLPIPQSNQGRDLKWNNIQSFLLKKQNESLSGNLYEMEITDKDLKNLSAQEPNWDDLPLTISTMVQIVEHKKETNISPKIYISSAGGSSAVNLLGRFCHADKKMHEYVQEIVAKEKELIPENSVLAEIIHLPESRLGNILLRPVFRDYEIPYLAKPAVENSKQIKLEDIMVSVRENRVVLRSKRLNKEVIPRLSTAHNYTLNALPIYQFLCDLQTQGIRGGVGFSWGTLANEYQFLPRVNYKNLILSRATWNVKKKTFEHIIKLKEESAMFDAVQKWRKENQVPAYVVLADSDNELVVNLENLLCVKTLISLVKNRPFFQLKEFLFDENTAIAQNANGAFTNQIVLSFYKNSNSAKINNQKITR